jgi:hypothetical protein
MPHTERVVVFDSTTGQPRYVWLEKIAGMGIHLPIQGDEGMRIAEIRFRPMGWTASEVVTTIGEMSSEDLEALDKVPAKNLPLCLHRIP